MNVYLTVVILSASASIYEAMDEWMDGWMDGWIHLISTKAAASGDLVQLQTERSEMSSRNSGHQLLSLLRSRI